MDEFTVSPLRTQTLNGFTFFHTGAETTMDAMHATIEELMGRLEAARQMGHVMQAGPVVFIYRWTGGSDTFRLETGFPVPEGTAAAGEAQVRTVPPTRSATAVLCGSLAHIAEACGAVEKAIQEAGLKMVGDYREYYLMFEGADSPNNVTLLTYGIES